MEQNPHIIGIRQGDAKTIRETWQDYSPVVSRWVIGGGGSGDDVQDIFQDALLIVYDKAGVPDFKLTSKFSTYFLGICRNLTGNLFQKKYFRHVTIPEEFKYMEESPINYDELERRNLFDKAKAQLGEDCRKLLDLFFQGKPMAEIAGIMGYASEGYAKRRKFMCKGNLEELVRNQPGFSELFNDKKL